MVVVLETLPPPSRLGQARDLGLDQEGMLGPGEHRAAPGPAGAGLRTGRGRLGPLCLAQRPWVPAGPTSNLRPHVSVPSRTRPRAVLTAWRFPRVFRGYAGEKKAPGKREERRSRVCNPEVGPASHSPPGSVSCLFLVEPGPPSPADLMGKGGGDLAGPALGTRQAGGPWPELPGLYVRERTELNCS